MEYVYDVYLHPLGGLPLVSQGEHLVYIGAFGESRESVQAALDPQGTARWQEGQLPQAREALAAYFAGQGPLALPYRLVGGTPFQRGVWAALASIPYGQTVSYKDLAERIGRPKSVRAVANAVGRNPLSILLPCHRVLTHQGRIGGYRGGLTMKRYLLDLEGCPISE